MTKEQMLRSMMTENQYNATVYYNMKLRKHIIEEAYMLYNNVSHTQGKNTWKKHIEIEKTESDNKNWRKRKC